MPPELTEIVSTSPAESTLVVRPLRRGQACLQCRRVKLKCDGGRPVCGICVRRGKEELCEYPEGLSRTKELENAILRLEARVQELEQSNQSAFSTSPAQFYQSVQMRASPDSSWPSNDSTFYFSPYPVTPRSNRGSPASSRGSPIGQSSPRGMGLETPFLSTEELPWLVIQTLVATFMTHSSQFGFFLDTSRFGESITLDHPARPSSALLNTVYLWGAHLSQSEPLVSQRDLFLSRSLQHSAISLASLSTHPQRVLQLIQAEVLLANYFFLNGQFLEAKCHSGLAVSLALGCGLHVIRSSQPSPQPTVGVSLNIAIMLPLPQDHIEEVERINGFWTVVILHKTLSVALGPPSGLCGALEAPGIQIDTPWPFDIDSYRERPLPADLRGSFTVRNFLNGSAGNVADSLSVIGANVKGALLFHRTSQLSRQWAPDMPQPQSHAFTTAFTTLDQIIDKFRTTLPPLSQSDGSTYSMTGTLVVTHALIEASVIILHSNFASSDSSSRRKSLAAARAIVQIDGVNIRDLGHLSPIMSTLWRTACQAFIDEILRIREHRHPWMPTLYVADENDLWASLRDGMSAMTMFADGNPLMRYHLSIIQERYAKI